MKKVFVSISLIHASSRDFLTGLFQYIESGHDWQLKIWQSEENPPTADKLKKELLNGLDGLILTQPTADDFNEVLVASDVPAVLVGVSDPVLAQRAPNTILIQSDNNGIGRLGANYLSSLGKFNSFGFVGTAIGCDWSAERETAFCQGIAEHGAKATAYRTEDAPGSDKDLFELSAWLISLSKPAAVMAACDWRAAQVLAACEMAKIKIPAQIALIGVDNDEFVCLHAFPPLSSIVPGHEEMGRLAAQTLDHLIQPQNVRKAKSKEVRLVPSRLHVIERESSRVLPPATRLVERAKQFIRENACSGIKVKDVVAHVRVSRRLLELRLREANGETIQGLIEKARLTLLKRLLTTTSRPIASLAKEAGFSNVNALAHLFKKRTGLSMRQFRATARQS